jgi:succinylglutamate desuccinylase
VPIQVAIVGGTHGNESNGVYLVKHFERNPSLVARQSFETVTLLANNDAIGTNTRYVEKDMNRCFLDASLKDSSLHSKEDFRAKEINNLLGPKASPTPGVDFVIDLHNTTSNSGVALMMSPKDTFAHTVGAYLNKVDEDVRIVEWDEKATDWGMLPTIARSGLTFEVGPVPWGCIDGKTFEQSKTLISAALDYIDKRNQSLQSENRKQWYEHCFIC